MPTCEHLTITQIPRGPTFDRDRLFAQPQSDLDKFRKAHLPALLHLLAGQASPFRQLAPAQAHQKWKLPQRASCLPWLPLTQRESLPSCPCESPRWAERNNWLSARIVKLHLGCVAPLTRHIPQDYSLGWHVPKQIADRRRR